MTFKSWFDSFNLYIKILALLILIWLYPLGIVFAIVYGISWIRAIKGNESLVQEMKEYLTNREKLDAMKSSVILKNDEKILYLNFSDFYEERAIRNYVRSGHSVRITKGWWYHFGSGQAESHGELRKIDSGVLFVTNKRFIFKGNLKSYAYPSNKILLIEPFTDVIRIGIDGRQKTLNFTIDKPELVRSAMRLFQGEKLNDIEEFIKDEIKMKIGERILRVKERVNFEKFNINEFEKAHDLFSELIPVLNREMKEYHGVLGKIPKEVLESIEEMNSILKKLSIIHKDLERVKENSKEINNERLEEEFNKIVKKNMLKPVEIRNEN